MANGAGNGPAKGLGDVRNLLGFLVAGFAGALNLLGLKSAEVGVILRNDSWRVSVISFFLLLGILAAVASVFVTSGEAHPVRLLWALLVFVLLASLFALSIWIIYSPAVTIKGEHTASITVTVALWVIAFVLLVFAIEQGGGPKALPELFNVQSMLLVAAVVLTSIATYGALRLETISQTTPVAALGDSLTTNGQVDTLTVSVSAAKLSTQEWLGLNVLAVPHRWHLQRMCRSLSAWKKQHAVAVTCAGDPCYYFVHALKKRCTELYGSVIPPDSSGAVHQSVQVLFSAAAYQHVQITAVACRPPPVISKRTPKGTCDPIENGGSSRLDLSIARAPRGTVSG